MVMVHVFILTVSKKMYSVTHCGVHYFCTINNPAVLEKTDDDLKIVTFILFSYLRNVIITYVIKSAYLKKMFWYLLSYLLKLIDNWIHLYILYTFNIGPILP